MPPMIELPDLPPTATVTLRLVLIVVAAVISILVVRAAVAVGVRHMREHRPEGAEPDAGPDPDLHRRIGTIGQLVVRIAASVIIVIAVLMALRLFGIDIAPAVAGLGVVGIAVGLGAQTLVKDWLAGVFIVLENQYSVGDVVRIAGVDGTVEEFGLRRTTLRDIDGTVHSVPNGQVTVASNLTRLWSRVNVDVIVAGGSDADRVSDLVDRVALDLHADPEWAPRLMQPPKVVRVERTPDSTISLKVLGQVRAADQWEVGGELRERIITALERAGIETPMARRAIPEAAPSAEA